MQIAITALNWLSFLDNRIFFALLQGRFFTVLTLKINLISAIINNQLFFNPYCRNVKKLIIYVKKNS